MVLASKMKRRIRVISRLNANGQIVDEAFHKEKDGFLGAYSSLIDKTYR